MQTEFSAKAYERMARRQALLVGMCLILGIGTAATSVLALTSRQTVIVPSMPETFRVSAVGTVDRDYLEMMGRDATYLFLNRTPETARYFERRIEAITDPATFQAIKKELIVDRQKREETRASQVFWPLEWYVKPDKLYVEVKGTLQQSSPTEVLESDDRIYGLTFSRRGSELRLKHFVEIKRDEAQITNARAEEPQESQP